MIQPSGLKSQHWRQFILDAEEEEHFEDAYLVWIIIARFRWQIIIFCDKNPDYDETTGQDNSGWRFSLAERSSPAEWDGDSINDCADAYRTKEEAYAAAYDYWVSYRNQTSLF